MHNLIFVTGNKEKIKEATSILPFPFSSHALELDEVQSLDAKYIVRKKAESAFELLQKPLFVDDAGLYMEAWKGFPGPLVKFIQTTGGPELMLSMLAAEKDRRASFKATIGYHDGTLVRFFHGEVLGTIPTTVQGDDGWGFDPIFIPDGYDKTFAELGADIKNALSHRRRALEAFKKYLETTALS
jgi:XTP/dITP diphosphohydrolase